MRDDRSLEWKPNIIGWMIYTAMGSYLAATALLSIGRGGATDRSRWFLTGYALFGAGAAAALAAWVGQWLRTGHVPMQTLFEVFLGLGASVFAVSALSRRLFQVGGEAWDALIGAVVLFPAGFVFPDSPRPLPPALQSPLFIPHVAAYLLAYVTLAKATVQAVRLLPADKAGGAAGPAEGALAMVRLGFPLLTLGLVLGSIWGRQAWGDYWNWDPKELWSLATWLIYAGYLHFRRSTKGNRPRGEACWLLAGQAAVLVTLLWVNLSRVFASELHGYAR